MCRWPALAGQTHDFILELFCSSISTACVTASIIVRRSQTAFAAWSYIVRFKSAMVGFIRL